MYLSTLWVVKRLKLLIGKKAKLEFLRTFSWYQNLLNSFGFDLIDYRSFNILMVDRMPKRLLQFLQGPELRNYGKFPYRLPVIRRRGSDLKIKGFLRSGT